MAVLGAVRGYEDWLKRGEEAAADEDDGSEKLDAEEGFADEDLKALEEADPLILMDDLDVGHVTEETAGISKLSLFSPNIDFLGGGGSHSFLLPQSFG
jgi:hypothetical protein